MPSLGLGLGLHRANRALFRGLLDQYGGASAAYSLRALSSGWLAGDVVEVRRSSDGTLQDFTASQITNGDLLTFCGVGDGFVSTWYDQSGNGVDQTNTTTTNQPKIVSAGALITRDGVVTVVNDGVDDKLANAVDTQLVNATDGTWTCFSVAAGDTAYAGTRGYIFSHDGLTRVAQMQKLTGNKLDAITFNTATAAFTDSSGTTGIGSMVQLSSVRRATDIEAYVNGSSDGATTTTGTPKALPDTSALWARDISLSGNNTIVNIAEVIVFGSDMSADRAAIEAEQKAYYNV